MRFYTLIFSLILTTSTLLTGCTDTSAPAGNSNSGAANANAKPAANSNALGTTRNPEAATSNAAPTVAPVVKAYYEALKKKDDAALRRVYTQAAVKSLEADMRAEKKTSLSEYITEVEPAPEHPFEIRNERLEGDTAIAEIRGGSYAVWTKIKFAREGGEWKMTNESPEFDNVTKSANTSK